MKGIPISKSSHYPKILKLTHQILETFGISRIKKYETLLIQFVYNSEYTENFIDDAINYLTKMAEKTLTGDFEDFIPSAVVDRLKEANELLLEKDNFLREALDRECARIDEERELRIKALRSLPRTLDPKALKLYLNDHLDFQLTEKELKDIMDGFMLFWKYYNPQTTEDWEFQWALNQYLTSIDSPMNRLCAGKVLGSIFEYLQETRLWGYPT